MCSMYDGMSESSTEVPRTVTEAVGGRLKRAERGSDGVARRCASGRRASCAEGCDGGGADGGGADGGGADGGGAA